MLKNHFHILIRIKTIKEIEKLSKEWCQYMLLPPTILNPTQQLSKAFNSYAKGMNKKYGRHGSMFQKRFRRIALTDHSHLLNTIAYINTNAQHHGLVDKFQHWKYTSYHLVVSEEPSIIRSLVLSLFGSRYACIEFHRAFVQASEYEQVFQE
jgi:hypothetical protein